MSTEIKYTCNEQPVEQPVSESVSQFDDDYYDDDSSRIVIHDEYDMSFDD